MSDAGKAGRWTPPRGRHRLPPELVARSQRERLLEAAVRVGTRKGFASVTITDLTGEAGVSRTTFYELFESKEECFLAAHDESVESLMRTVVSSCEGEQRWPERVQAGIQRLLGALSEDPDLARFTLIDIGGVGPAGQRRLRTAVQRLAPYFDEGRDYAPGGRDLPPNTSRMAIGGVAGLLVEEVLEGRAERLPELTSEVLLLSLTPYIGRDAAAKELDRGW